MKPNDFLPDMSSAVNLDIGRYNSAVRNIFRRRHGDIIQSVTMNGNGICSYRGAAVSDDGRVSLDCHSIAVGDTTCGIKTSIGEEGKALFLEVSYKGHLSIEKDVTDSGMEIPIENFTETPEFRFFSMDVSKNGNEYILNKWPVMQWTVGDGLGRRVDFEIENDVFIETDQPVFPIKVSGANIVPTEYGYVDIPGIGMLFESPNDMGLSVLSADENCPEWVYERPTYCVFLGIFEKNGQDGRVSRSTSMIYRNRGDIRDGIKIVATHVARVVSGDFQQGESPNTEKTIFGNDVVIDSGAVHSSTVSDAARLRTDRISSGTIGFSPNVFTKSAGKGVSSRDSMVVDFIGDDDTYKTGVVRTENAIVGSLVSSKIGFQDEGPCYVELVGGDGTVLTNVVDGTRVEDLKNATVLRGVVSTNAVIVDSPDHKLKIGYIDEETGNVKMDGTVEVTLDEEAIKTKRIVYKDSPAEGEIFDYRDYRVVVNSRLNDEPQEDGSYNITTFFGALYDRKASDKEIYNWGPCAPGTSLEGVLDKGHIKVSDEFQIESEENPGQESGGSDDSKGYREWTKREIKQAEEGLWDVTEYYDLSICDYRHPDLATRLIEVALDDSGKPIVEDGKIKLTGSSGGIKLSSDGSGQGTDDWKTSNYIDEGTGFLKVTFKDGWNRLVYHPHVSFTYRPSRETIMENDGALKVGTLDVVGATWMRNGQEKTQRPEIVVGKDGGNKIIISDESISIIPEGSSSATTTIGRSSITSGGLTIRSEVPEKSFNGAQILIRDDEYTRLYLNRKYEDGTSNQSVIGLYDEGTGEEKTHWAYFNGNNASVQISSLQNIRIATGASGKVEVRSQNVELQNNLSVKNIIASGSIESSKLKISDPEGIEAAGVKARTLETNSIKSVENKHLAFGTPVMLMSLWIANGEWTCSVGGEYIFEKVDSEEASMKLSEIAPQDGMFFVGGQQNKPGGTVENAKSFWISKGASAIKQVLDRADDEATLGDASGKFVGFAWKI